MADNDTVKQKGDQETKNCGSMHLWMMQLLFDDLRFLN